MFFPTLSTPSFQIDFDPLAIEEKIIAANSDQRSITSEDFNDDSEFSDISHVIIVRRYFSASTSE